MVTKSPINFLLDDFFVLNFILFIKTPEKCPHKSNIRMGKCPLEKYFSKDEKIKNICLASCLRARPVSKEQWNQEKSGESVEGHCSPMTIQTQTHSPFLKTF